MTQRPSAAERLDHALDSLLAGGTPAAAAAAAGLEAVRRPLVTLAADLQAALPVPVVAPRFEARLGTHLADAAHARDPLAWAIRHPGRLIVTGAVGSAAVGVGVTAFAVWRSTRRSSRSAHRLIGR